VNEATQRGRYLSGVRFPIEGVRPSGVLQALKNGTSPVVINPTLAGTALATEIEMGWSAGLESKLGAARSCYPARHPTGNQPPLSAVFLQLWRINAASA
jgi:hypothetical protein